MDKTINQKAWFLVLPVFLIVAFSAVKAMGYTSW
jgi:glycerol transport system permease protein